MPIRSKFMANFYVVSMKKIEACLAAWREKLLSGGAGDVLVIVSGTGSNLPYYPNSINSLVLTEMLISHAGFTSKTIERINSSGTPSIFSPTIKGTASKNV